MYDIFWTFGRIFSKLVTVFDSAYFPAKRQTAPQRNRHGMNRDDNRLLLVAAPRGLLSAVIVRSLAGLDIRVEVAYTKRDFETMCLQRPYKVVVTLFSDSFLCGADIVRRMKSRRIPKPKIYLLSWLQGEQTVMSLFESGVDQYLSLPVNVPRLVGKISREFDPAAGGENSSR